MPEGFTVLVLKLGGDVRMTVFVAVIYVWTAVIVEVPASAFHTILKAATLDFAAHPRSHIRAAAIGLAHLLFWPARLALWTAHEV
jgi:hypothetical protein